MALRLGKDMALEPFLVGNACGPRHYERVIRGIIQRYIMADSGFNAPHGGKSHVPRFLLNDIVRFWRTMCVDFAWKGWEQEGKKWALRNIKLRMSRKLIFISGLLMIASCYENDKLKNSTDQEEQEAYLEHLLRYVKMTPLEIVCDTLPMYVEPETVGELVDRYNYFLEFLNNSSKRKELEGLDQKKAYENETFLDARKLSHEFQGIINEVFFKLDSPLKEFTIQYGVF